MALDGIKRMQGAGKRRKPVTPGMLRRIRAKLAPRRSFDHAVLWATVRVAWFFLLRLSEYAVHDGGHRDPKKGLQGRDVVPSCAGQRVASFALADEVVLTIRGSKTDVYNQGETRNHFRSEDGELCIIKALEELERHDPTLFKEDCTRYVCNWQG